MLTSTNIINETVRSLRAASILTAGELKLLLDIYNSTMLTPMALDRDSLDLQVRDSFTLYPGMYEDKWGVDKSMLDKISKLSNFQAACLQIWAVEFWGAGCYTEDDSINLYVQGKLTAISRLERAGELLKTAVEIQEKSKSAFKSAAIAEARNKCEQAERILIDITQ
jgi:hypothetical protein